jgi:hypothetical protein
MPISLLICLYLNKSVQKSQYSKSMVLPKGRIRGMVLMKRIRENFKEVDKIVTTRLSITIMRIMLIN